MDDKGRKSQWQRTKRHQFKEEHGYSQNADYGTGKLRKEVLERDGHKCVKCSMTDEEHKEKWDRPITIDHKDRDHSNNIMDNFQTLCLSCHGRKDLSPQLKIKKLESFKHFIMQLRTEFGTPYEVLAKHFRCSIATVWKSVRRWEGEAI
jgi:5-methylcytosine-specific restriction endonuclease McrA